LPDSFVIITSGSNGILFAQYPNVLTVSSFPSLTNTGDNLLLKNNNGTLIHYVPYTDAWYADEAKKDGGWALELIDAENPCNGQENWRASTDAGGGTPGRKNSVTTSNPDTVLPQLIRAALVDANTLMLYFSEPLNNGTANVPSNFVVNNGVGSPLLSLPIPFDYKQVQLEFLNNFMPGTIYTVKALNLTDCSGNPIGMSDTARFAIADTPSVGDIVINEILFNPSTSGYDFVELYNRSSKIFDLKQLDILEKDFNAPEIVLEQSAASAESYLLFPGEYVVLTENAENIRQAYFCRNANTLVETALPNYDDNESICLLKLHNSYTIDSLAYENDWQYALLDNEDGVSLERIDFNSITSDKNAWHSAASTVGFATPTYLNSQYSETGISEDAIAITPPVFTPDNDGDKDAVFIQYQFSEPGYTCNVRLYDAKGREIKYLVKQELLGSQGQFQWDGTDDEGRKARIGIYVAYVEIFNLNGKVKRYKKELVLGGKLN
ncbi:MAG: lamin tail domain-containing protein, partial [Bacteroidetes bacterium]|nr:lamin tail domain-containing protein [Bacteroidota bacterium]